MTNTRAILGLVAWLLASFSAAALGSYFTVPALPAWYPTIAKPPWTPPEWVFGPVWTLLYTMMGAAAWVVWAKKGFAGARGALGLFLAQLALNALWSVIFFGWRMPGAAFAEIILLCCAVAATARAFFRHSAPAGWLLVPYALWLLFAAALNFAIWRLNP